MDIEVLPGNNGSSSNGSNGVTPKVTRKFQRRPETWTKNVKKMKQAKGEEYTTKSGKVIPALESRVSHVSASVNVSQSLPQTNKTVSSEVSMISPTKICKIHICLG